MFQAKEKESNSMSPELIYFYERILKPVPNQNRSSTPTRKFFNCKQTADQKCKQIKFNFR